MSAESSSPSPDGRGRIFRLIRAGWTVVEAAASDPDWLGACLEFCPDARYHVFPRTAADAAGLAAAVAGTGSHVTVASVPLGKPGVAGCQSLDAARTEAGIRHIHYLRIEAPEAAMETLLGAKQLLQHSRIDVIEIAGPESGTRGLGPLVFILEHHEYVLMRLRENEFERVTQADLAADFWTGNTIAIHARLLTSFTEADSEVLDLPELLGRFRVPLRGVIHLGAHEAEELPTYLNNGASRVLLVEANPVLAQRLQSRVSDTPGVMVAHCAINDREGPVTLRLTSFDEASSILPLKGHQAIYPTIVETGAVEVPGMSLDRLMDQLGLDAGDFNFMALDIQGAELRALQGAARTLKSIQAISVEINFEELYEGSPQVEDIDRHLGEHGFSRVATLTPYHPAWGDALYLRKDIAMGLPVQ